MRLDWEPEDLPKKIFESPTADLSRKSNNARLVIKFLCSKQLCTFTASEESNITKITCYKLEDDKFIFSKSVWNVHLLISLNILYKTRDMCIPYIFMSLKGMSKTGNKIANEASHNRIILSVFRYERGI